MNKIQTSLHYICHCKEAFNLMDVVLRGLRTGAWGK